MPSTMIMTSLVSHVPAADLFGTGTSLGGKFETACIAVAGAFVAYFMLKQLTKISTVMGGVIAIAGAFVLFWALDNVNNSQLRKPLDDTVKDAVKGMSQVHPAGDRATAFLENGSSA